MRPWLQLVVMLGGPVAWVLHLMIAYPLVPMVCRTEQGFLLHAVNAATFLLAAGSAAAALRLRRAAAEEPGGRRTRFVGSAGVLMAVFFALVIAVESLPTWIQDPCS